MNRTFLLSALLSLPLLSASAKTAVWWQMQPQSTTAAAVNVAGTDMPGLGDRVITSFGTSPSWSPKETESLKFASSAPSAFTRPAVMTDPVGGTRRANISAKRTWSRDATSNAVLLVGYDATKFAALKTQEGTVEVLFRLPPDARGAGSNQMFPLVMLGRDTLQGYMMSIYRVSTDKYQPFFRATVKAADDASATTVSYYPTSSCFSLNDGRWHHLAVTFSRTTGKIRMYLDYVLLSGTDLDKDIHYGAGHFYVGANPYNVGRTFEGDIADIRISDAVLTTAQFLRPSTALAPVDGDTAVYLPFGENDFVGQLKSDNGSTTWTHPYWNIFNAATDTTYAPYWTLCATNSTTTFPETSARETGTIVRARNDDTAFEDCAALRLNGHLKVGNIITIPRIQQLAGTHDLTFECFMKAGAFASDRVLWNGGWGKLVLRSSGLFVFRAYELVGESYLNREITTTQRLDDDSWHHLAVVYHGTDATPWWEAFVDHQSVGTRANAIPDAHIATKDANYFLSDNTTAFGFNGEVDDLRITRRALHVSEFLTNDTRALALAAVDFENGTIDGTNEITKASVALTSGGVRRAEDAPAVVANTRAGKTLLGGKPIANGKALQLNGGYLAFARTTDFSLDSFTVEFFAKFTAFQRYASVLRYSTGNGRGGTGDTTIWSLNAAESGNLNITMYIPDGKGGSKNISGSVVRLDEITDGLWRHYVIQFAHDESTGKMSWTAYIDGKKVTVKAGSSVSSIPGRFDYPATGGTLAIGAASLWFDGTIDNVRILRGVVSPSELQSFDAAGSHVKLR